MVKIKCLSSTSTTTPSPFKPDSKNSVSHKSYICTEANFKSFINWYLSVDIHNVLGIAF